MSEYESEPSTPPNLVGGAAAYGGKKVSGFMFGLKQGGGLLVWEGELRREDRQWAEVPPMPQAEAELRHAFDAAMSKAPKGAVSRIGRGIGLPLVLVGPNAKARVDAGPPGQTKSPYYEDLSRDVCTGLMDLWKVPLPAAEVPRSLPSRFQFSAQSERGSFAEEQVVARPESSRFGFESQLQGCLVTNWSALPLSNSLEIVGSEYSAGDLGRIDIFCKNTNGSGYTVIELKRGLTGDAVVGQVLRYMGWVRANRIKGNQSVSGIIICYSADPKLRAAISVAPNIDVYTYERQVAPDGMLQFCLSKLSKVD